jgi:hypothetical protein
MEGRRCVAEVLAGIDENINYYEQGLHWAKNNPNVNYKCAQSSPVTLGTMRSKQQYVDLSRLLQALQTRTIVVVDCCGRLSLSIFFAIDFCHVACLCCRRSLSTFAVEFLRS